MDTNRARQIVVMAADMDSSASSWLRLDERGSWEKRAQLTLDDERLRDRANQLSLSDAQLDQQIAVQLNVVALQAVLESAKRPTKVRKEERHVSRVESRRLVNDHAAYLKAAR